MKKVKYLERDSLVTNKEHMLALWKENTAIDRIDEFSLFCFVKRVYIFRYEIDRIFYEEKVFYIIINSVRDFL